MNYLWNYWEGYGYAYGPFISDDQLNNGDLVIPDDNADDLWNRHYMALLNINNALGSIKKGNIKGETQETIDGLEAQGKFLRAHNYFMLVRMFGGVPLITEDTPDPIVNPMPRASVAEVYALIVSDLTFAAAHLPESWSGAPGKPTSGAAKGILAKAYLTMATYPLNEPSNYQKAADMALEVMNSGVYHLVDSVDEVFTLANKYGSEMMWSYNSTYDDIATDPEIWTTSSYLDGGWGDAAMDTSFEHRWPDQPRKEAYVFTHWNGKHYTDFDEQTPFCKKFFFYISSDDFNGYSSIMNYPIIRYADVLLIYAEAANMASAGATAPQSAVDAINNIFDGCKLVTGYVPAAGGAGRVITSNSISSQPSLIVTAFPNPYQENFSLKINSPVTGQAMISFYTMNGVKIGEMKRDVVAMKDVWVPYNVPAVYRTRIVYTVTVGSFNAKGIVLSPN